MELESGYRKLFWGYFFIMFHINLGTLQILPSFVGWSMVVVGVSMFQAIYPQKYMRDAYRLAIVLCAESVISFVMGLAFISFLNSTWWTVIILVLETIFLYYVFQGLSMYYHEHYEEKKAISTSKFLKWFLILQTVFILTYLLTWVTMNQQCLMLATILGLIIRLLVMSRFGKSRWYSEQAYEDNMIHVQPEQDKMVNEQPEQDNMVDERPEQEKMKDK